MAGNDESERTAAGNDGKRVRQPEEGLPCQRGVIMALEAAEVPGFLVLFLEYSKYRTPVFGSILGTISVMSQICDRHLLCA